MRKVATLLTLFLPLFLLGQTTYNSSLRKAKKVSTIDLRQMQSGFQSQLEPLYVPSPGGDSYRDYLREVKEKLSHQYPKKEVVSQQRSSQKALSPKQGKNFGTFRFRENSFLFDSALVNNGNPSDHTMAISNDGFLMLGWNTHFWAYDVIEDTLALNHHEHLTSISFTDFVKDAGIGLNFPFDPKILYDPQEDRFILLFLSGRGPNDSKIIVAFSETNHPGGKWNIYEIDGNPNGTNEWTDYPAMAITKDEVFITVNLLREGEPWQTGFAETIIWQIDKQSGYQGNTDIDLKLWKDIKYNDEALRYFPPIQGGSDLDGPNCFFISNRSIPQLVDTIVLLSDSIFLIEITDVLSNPNSELTVKVLVADNIYGTPPNAEQQGTKTLNTNDSRVLGGFIENGEIQFVGNTLDTATGGAAIYHGFITDLNNPSPNCRLNIIGGDILNGERLDIGYPNIAYAGINSGDRAAIIGVNHSSENNFAGNSCFFFDNGENYSAQVILKEGIDIIDELPMQDERWGDYTGIQRNYASPNKAWMAAYYGMGNRRNTSWVSELELPLPFAVNIEEKEKNQNKIHINVYPNPSTDFVSVSFQNNTSQYITFSLFNQKGQLVEILNKDYVKEGNYKYSFSTLALTSGIYFLKISAEEQLISTEKLIVK